MVYLGLSPTLTFIGYLSGNEAWVNAGAWVVSPWPMFLIGSGILILSGVILSSGMRFYLMVQKWIFTIAVLGSVMLIFTLLPYSNADFIASFNALMGPILSVENPYTEIISSGREAGWAWDGKTDWTQTWLVSNWPFLPLVGAAFSIAIGGEIKSVEKSQKWGMLGAVATATIVWVITIYLCTDRFRLRVPRHRRVQFPGRHRRSGRSDHHPAGRCAHRLAADLHSRLARLHLLDVDVDSRHAHIWSSRHRRLVF